MAFERGTEQKLPVKAPKKQKRVEEYTVFILSCEGRYALQKRPETGLLAGLWQFPNVSGKLEIPDAMAVLEDMGLRPRHLLRQSERKHIFTHIRWEMRGFWVETEAVSGPFHWLTPEEIVRDAALPTAFRQFWQETVQH